MDYSALSLTTSPSLGVQITDPGVPVSGTYTIRVKAKLQNGVEGLGDTTLTVINC